jgi:hypothetical protein
MDKSISNPEIDRLIHILICRVMYLFSIREENEAIDLIIACIEKRKNIREKCGDVNG